jgi:ABC-type branched-subunit amino acid transport system substrate-binding protein
VSVVEFVSRRTGHGAEEGGASAVMSDSEYRHNPGSTAPLTAAPGAKGERDVGQEQGNLHFGRGLGRSNTARVTFVLAAILLLASACKSQSTADSSKSTTTAASATPTKTVDPRAPGVTDDSIKIGVTYVDLSSLKDVLKIDNGNLERAYTLAIDAINAKGGINGRKLDPVFVPINPTQPNAFDAACTKLTQDEKVFVTIGFFLGDDVLCYLNTNQTPAIGGPMTNDRLAKAKVAWYTTDPQGQDLEAEVVKTMAEDGKLKGKVAVVGLAADQQNYEDTLKPLLDKAKVDVVDTAFVDAPTTDANATFAQNQTFAERFQSKGADQVLAIGQSAAGFLTGLAKTDYRPQVRITLRESGETYSQAAGSDLSVLKGSLTGSTFDGRNKYPSLGGATKECVDTMEKAGVKLQPLNQVPEGQPKEIIAVDTACEQVYLLQGILEKAGKDLNFGSFKTAGDSLGKIDIPFFSEPLNYGPPPSADGDPKAYIYNWDAGSKQFVMAN